MLDWELNMAEKKDKANVLLSEVEVDFKMLESAEISKTRIQIYQINDWRN